VRVQSIGMSKRSNGSMPADDPLGGDGAAQLGQVDGLGVGEYDEVDQVLDSAAAFAARVVGVG